MQVDPSTEPSADDDEENRRLNVRELIGRARTFIVEDLWSMDLGTRSLAGSVR